VAVRHAHQRTDLAVLAGLLDDFTAQPGLGGLSEVGTAAGQMPPAGTGIPLRDKREQDVVRRVGGEPYAANRCRRVED
jgi:hypothetical protein